MTSNAAPDTINRHTPTLRPKDRVVMWQSWRELLFLHWPVAPEAIQALLPPGLTVDTFEGKAYVGLVPFTMRDVRPLWSPSVACLSHFHECNVRTYVHQDGHDPGVWFFSLDAANPVAVQLARRLFFLPYFHARMRLERDGEQRIYRTERYQTDPGAASCQVTYTPQGTPAPAASGTLEFFLAERYLLYAHRGKRLFRGQVHHTPYPLQPVRVTDLQQTLTKAAGFHLDTPNEPPLAHYASEVSVEVFPLKRTT